MDIKQKIEQANSEAVQRLTSGDPVLVDIAPAGEVIPGMQGKMITHAGPPIEWERMCGAQKGAIIGQVIFEGWAKIRWKKLRALLEKGGDPPGTQPPSSNSGSDGRHDFCHPCRYLWWKTVPLATVLSAGKWKASSNLAITAQEALDGLRKWRDV